MVEGWGPRGGGTEGEGGGQGGPGHAQLGERAVDGIGVAARHRRRMMKRTKMPRRRVRGNINDTERKRREEKRREEKEREREIVYSAVLSLLINIKSCRPVQYEQKPMTQTRKNGQEKVFLHILTRVNTRNKAENISLSHFR